MKEESIDSWLKVLKNLQLFMEFGMSQKGINFVI